ncbi:MAG: thiamine pyrophosphate-dependent enzyme [Polyangiaceae bacterium]|jgi:2-oxoisovalerate dehydrogenase E1 component alpha subunit|nr:thiamine pyrophosphate-dependent enzyme [Polyangiaceae bacterium]
MNGPVNVAGGEEVQGPEVRIMRDDGSLDPDQDPGMPVEQAVWAYRAMVRTRRVDERLVSLQRQGRVGFHIGSLGEEATIIGSALALRDVDYIFPAYREFGAALLRGFPLQRYFDNMFGNANDPARGRQMPDHYSARAVRFGSVSSPIGTQITHAVGFAWAAKLRGEDLVTLSYFGEGATSSNEFHNGMNFAGVFQVPTILLCRNNHWAISVPSDRQTASETFAQKGQAYGVRFVRCDGNDLFAVARCTRQAVELAATGRGPTLIEALTYRMAGHSTSDDPSIYRHAQDIERWRARDPIARLRQHLEVVKAWDDARQESLEHEIDTEIKDAIVQAEETDPPTLASMFDDVFAELPWHLIEQREALLAGPRAPRHA